MNCLSKKIMDLSMKSTNLTNTTNCAQENKYYSFSNIFLINAFISVSICKTKNIEKKSL